MRMFIQLYLLLTIKIMIANSDIGLNEQELEMRSILIRVQQVRKVASSFFPVSAVILVYLFRNFWRQQCTQGTDKRPTPRISNRCGYKPVLLLINMATPALELLPSAVLSCGQVWLGIENIKLKETANAVKQLPLKPAILNRVGSDWLGRFGLALKRPNHQNMLKNSEVITIFMQVTIFPTECSVISCCSNNVETYNYALWWAGSAW